MEVMDKHEIEKRKMALEKFLRANGISEKERIQRSVAVMMGLRQVGRNVSEKEAAANVAGIVAAVIDVPAYFVEQACVDFSRGDVPGDSLAFAPNSAQIRQHAISLMTKFKEEIHVIRNILGASYRKTITEQERKRVGFLLAELAVEMRENSGNVDDGSKAIAARVSDSMKSASERLIAKARTYYGSSEEDTGMASPYLAQKLTGRPGGRKVHDYWPETP